MKYTGRYVEFIERFSSDPMAGQVLHFLDIFNEIHDMRTVDETYKSCPGVLDYHFKQSKLWIKTIQDCGLAENYDLTEAADGLLFHTEQVRYFALAPDIRRSDMILQVYKNAIIAFKKAGIGQDGKQE